MENLIVFAGSVLATALLLGLARRRGWLVQPRADRWHQQPTALFGGGAIYAAFALGVLMLGGRLGEGHRYDVAGLLVGATLVFVLGLIDDIRPINPLVKLTGQVISVLPFVVGLGLSNTSTSFVVAIPLIVLWMLALINAFNLLDNMDGLAAGAASIASLFVALRATEGSLIEALATMLALACLGFLLFNFRLRRPARIFMGDCGSMFIGYVVAGLCTLSLWGQGRATAVTWMVPLLTMALPLFDTCFVIVRRKLEGRAITQGGRDHTSHRLVYFGFAERDAVILLYAVAAVCGSLGGSVERLPALAAWCVSGACGLGLLSLGRLLGRYTRPVEAPAHEDVAPAALAS
jgi:UDP-GlcNAc:undecaprenyl-phosphate/decaprenyl-phosphate GlcNAc-1-phosphate transferase